MPDLAALFIDCREIRPEQIARLGGLCGAVEANSFPYNQQQPAGSAQFGPVETTGKSGP